MCSIILKWKSPTCCRKQASVHTRVLCSSWLTVNATISASIQHYERAVWTPLEAVRKGWTIPVCLPQLHMWWVMAQSLSTEIRRICICQGPSPSSQASSRLPGTSLRSPIEKVPPDRFGGTVKHTLLSQGGGMSRPQMTNRKQIWCQVLLGESGGHQKIWWTSPWGCAAVGKKICVHLPCWHHFLLYLMCSKWSSQHGINYNTKGAPNLEHSCRCVPQLCVGIKLRKTFPCLWVRNLTEIAITISEPESCNSWHTCLTHAVF